MDNGGLWLPCGPARLRWARRAVFVLARHGGWQVVKGKTHLLNLESLHLVDEELTQRFNEILSGLVTDCRNRPLISNARKVPLEIRLKPIVDGRGQCKDVEVELATKPVCPPIVSEVAKMVSTVHGSLKFVPGAQQELPFEE